MNNRHAGLSQLLADQHITDRHDEAAHARLARSARRSRRCKRWMTHGWWQKARWPGVATQPAVRHPTSHPLIDRRTTMSKLARVLTVGAMLAGMNLAGMTTVVHAQANDPTSDEGARRAPTERQVGESWRHRKVASQEQVAADATLGRVLARERFSIPHQTPAQVPAPAAAQPSRQPGWLVVWLGMLAAAVAVVAGLVVLAARRANRRARVGPAT